MDESLPQRIRPLMRTPQAQVDAGREAALSGTFEELFLAHWPMICRLLVRLVGDPDEAQDLALETFYRLYRHPPKTGEGSNLKGWLYRVATNLGLHSLRSSRRRLAYELAAGKDALEQTAEDDPQEAVEKKEDRRLARLALSRLPIRQAQLLSLRYSGLAYTEIAQALDLAPSSIGPLLLRAERQFTRIYRSLSREEP